MSRDHQVEALYIDADSESYEGEEQPIRARKNQRTLLRGQGQGRGRAQRRNETARRQALQELREQAQEAF